MTGRTGSPEARVALPAVCPGCGRTNSWEGTHSGALTIERGRVSFGNGWVKYRSDPNVVGCGGCGHVVYHDGAGLPIAAAIESLYPEEGEE